MTEPAPRVRCQRCAAAFDPSTAKDLGKAPIAYRNHAFHDIAFRSCPECGALAWWFRCGCTERARLEIDERDGFCPKRTER